MGKLFSKFFIVFALGLVSFTGRGQFTASFTSSDTAGCAPYIAHFTNSSTGTPSFSWDMGDGSAPTTFTDASNIYASPGTYTVTLTATVGSVSHAFSMVVRVYPPPTVSFYASDTAICPGSATTFTSTSTSGAWGSLAYSWNFGDGYTSTGTSPTHSYTSPGYYTLTLFATSRPGCVSSATRSSYIHVFTPASVFFHTPDSFFCKAPATSHFTNFSTGYPSLSYTWKFGDGGTSTAVSPAHTYSVPGSYPVTLVVRDGHFCTDSMVSASNISVGSLAARFSSPASACRFSSVSFSNTSTPHISSKWNFGDGDSSFIDMPTHTYTANGTYSVKLIVSDGTCTDTVIHPITINAPSGTCAISPAHPCPAPNLMTFSATVPPGCVVDWMFSDTTFGSGTPISHLYRWQEIDTQSMVITDPAGCKDTLLVYDTAYYHVLQLSASPNAGCVPLTVDFTPNDFSLMFDPLTLLYRSIPYPYTITSYVWNFGDGSPPVTGPSPTHIYTVRGSYTATCSITTSNGCTLSSTVDVSCGIHPVASFTMSPRHACNNVPVTFRSTSTGANSYYWYYGDILADSCVCSTMTHTYFSPGIFTPHLYVYDNGCPSVAVYANDTIDSPKAVMHLSYGCTPRNVVSFSNYSMGATSLLWFFGDGTSSTSPLPAPVHTYTALSSYNVMLTTYNAASGCRDTASMVVDVSKPVVRIWARDSSICRDQIDTFQTAFISSLVPIRNRWYVDGVLTDSIHNRFIETYHVRGVHSVVLVNTDNHGCLDTSNTNSLVVAKPITSYSFTPTSGCGATPVAFTDYSSDVPGAVINRYVWSFGDGATSTTGLPTVTHSYTAPGVYNVREIVTDDQGCKDTLNSPTHPTFTKPVASFSITATNVCAGAIAHFNNTSPSIVGAYWSFGDGATSTVISPDHAYSAMGTYTLKLVVIDSRGCPSDTLVRSSLINVVPSPVASFTMSDSFAVCPPLNVIFTNTSLGGATWYWDFGDTSSSTAFGPSNVYHHSALYTIKLAAINSYGCTDTAVGHASIFGYRGSFTTTPIGGCSPLPVHFAASVSHVMNLVWDFNDGITSGSSTSDTITHTYRTAGAYLPKLILTDSSGCLNFSLGTDTIKVDALTPAFVATPNPVCANGSVAFSDASSSYYSADTSWLWTFGSGATSTLASPTYTFTASGTIPVTLLVNNRMKCAASVTQSVLVNPRPSPITGVTSVCAGMTTALFNTGGGSWSSSASPSVATINSSTGSVSGVAAGSALVTYTLPSGCTVNTTVTVFSAPTPIAGVTTLCAGATTTLTDPTAGGTWSSSNTSVATIGSGSGMLRGVTAGTAIVTYSNVPGLSCVATTTITVIPIPVAIGGASSVCEGYTTILTDATPGGSWASGDIFVAGIGSGSGLVSAVSAGTSTITYAIGSCANTKIIRINPLSPITGVTTICAGLTTTLSNVVTGGTWVSTSSSVASIGSLTGTVTGVSFGTTVISYILPTGCTATTTVSVNSVPTLFTGAANVCIGYTVALTGPGGGAWSTGNPAVALVGSGSGVVSGVSAGTASITYSFGTGCSSSTVVNVYPVPSAIAGTLQVCTGSNTFLSDPSPGGVWSSVSTATATINGVTGVSGGVSAGTSIISYSRYGCAATATLTVNPLPGPITGSTDVCAAGSTALLSDAAPGGAWGSSNMSVATIGVTTGVVTGVSAGATLITYTLSTGCITTRLMTVNPLPPAITGTAQVCEGGAVTYLHDAIGPGNWASGDPAVATIDVSSGMATGVSAGTAAITYTLTTGCSAYKILTVNPLPGAITGSPIACVGLTNALIAPLPGGTWSSSDNTIATVTAGTGVVTGVNPGAVTITYVLPTGCGTTFAENVNPVPLPITGIPFLCVGQTTSLFDVSPGGAWSSANTSIATVISWSAGTGTVTGVSAGPVTISYTIGGCPSVTTALVNLTPAPIAGVVDICAWGSHMVVSDADTPGTWSSTAIAISTTGVVTSYGPGVATITYSLPTGCATTATVGVNPLPSPISGPGYVCIGGTATLSDITPGGSWSCAGASAIATVDASGVVTGIANGVAEITYTGLTGCISTRTIAVNPLPSLLTGTPRVCVGDTIILSDSTGGGVWSSGDMAIASVVPAGAGLTGVVKGVSAGSVIVSYSITNLCGTNTVSKVITVYPQPDAGVINGPSSLCVGNAVVFSDAAPGGTWSLANNLATIAGSLVTPLSAGVDTVKYTVTNSCGTDIATHSVTINLMPDAGTISGPNEVCAGMQVTLGETQTGGAWGSLNATATITVAGAVSAVTAGIDTMTYTLANICGTAVASHAITINPLPDAGSIAGPAEACIGTAITMTNTAVNGLWSLTGGFASIAGNVFTLLSVGVDTIKYTVSNSCGTAVIAQPITINPLPDAGAITGADSLCPGDTIIVANAIAGGSWSSGDTSVLLVNSLGVVSGIATGKSNVIYSVSNSCGAANAALPVTVRTLVACEGNPKMTYSIGCSGGSEIILYPNPNPGQFNVEISSAVKEEVHFVIINALGQKIKTLSAMTNTLIAIKLDEAPGIYMFMAITGHGKCVEKINITR